MFVENLFKKVIRKFSELNMTIRSKIICSFIIVIMMMTIMNIILLLSFLKCNERYSNIVSNITEANSINGVLKVSIDSEMWDIVSGKKRFNEGKQYEIIDEFNGKVNEIMKNVITEDSRIRLDVTLRTMNTLRHYVDVIGEQIKEKKTFEENEKVLDNVRGVSSLVEEDISDFIMNEVRNCEKVKLEIQKSVNDWIITDIVVFCIVLLFSIAAALFISGSISRPIRELRKMAASIAEGNLNVRVENNKMDEIASLAVSLNIMAEKLKELIDNSIKEQENLKKSELKALQAQINPHFLYNTLDTIVWMSEANKSEQVIELVEALSKFFRITLSKGRDWITIRDEVEHVKSYLIIQKIRYRDILNFKMEIEEDIMEYKILKLTLQPIVENALYHGIKNKRTGGEIIVRASKARDRDLIFLEVIDNGIGMTVDKLSRLRAELNDDNVEQDIRECGFGLSNVYKRIKLYYGKQYGVSIESEYGEGTKVSLCIPCER